MAVVPVVPICQLTVAVAAVPVVIVAQAAMVVSNSQPLLQVRVAVAVVEMGALQAPILTVAAAAVWVS